MVRNDIPQVLVPSRSPLPKRIIGVETGGFCPHGRKDASINLEQVDQLNGTSRPQN